MKTQSRKTDYANQEVFVGIDVHKTSWTVAIRVHGVQVMRMAMAPETELLISHLQQQYANAQYQVVYEAGFCGFHIARKLKLAGIETIIVNPAHVPSNYQDKLNKNDSIDAARLAMELEKGTLQPYAMYIPKEQEEGLRCLVRLIRQQTRDLVRTKIRIKSLLNFLGVSLPDKVHPQTWNRSLLFYLEELTLPDTAATLTLGLQIGYLRQQWTALLKSRRVFRQVIRENPSAREIIACISSLPGIGFITASVIYTELMNNKRFSTGEKLCRYVGLTPDVRASGEKSRNLGLNRMYLRYLRNTMIEAAWASIHYDDELLEAYGNYCKRMSKKKAIIKIARKLLMRVLYVWRNKTPYKSKAA